MKLLSVKGVFSYMFKRIIVSIRITLIPIKTDM